jgi:hypothetical protein
VNRGATGPIKVQARFPYHARAIFVPKFVASEGSCDGGRNGCCGARRRIVNDRVIVRDKAL